MLERSKILPKKIRGVKILVWLFYSRLLVRNLKHSPICLCFSWHIPRPLASLRSQWFLFYWPLLSYPVCETLVSTLPWRPTWKQCQHLTVLWLLRLVTWFSGREQVAPLAQWQDPAGIWRIPLSHWTKNPLTPTHIWLLFSVGLCTIGIHLQVKWLCSRRGCLSAQSLISSDRNMTPGWTSSFHPFCDAMKHTEVPVPSTGNGEGVNHLF